MIDYLEIAARALERFQARPESYPRPPAMLPGAERAAATRETSEVWISWYEWKARELNRLFLEQGLTGQPGRIAAETVRHGLEQPARTKITNVDPYEERHQTR